MKFALLHREFFRHGEAGAVAACSELFNDYHNTISSKEYVAAAPKQTTKHIPLSGLNAANLDDFFKPPPCSGQFESCKAREVNDSDVKAFVKKVSQPPQKKDARLSKDVNKHKPAAAKGSKSDIPQSSNDSSRKRKDEADPLAFLKKFSQPPQKSTAPKTNVQPPSKLTLLDKINNSLSKRPNPSPQLSSGASTVAQPSNPPPKLQQQPANDRPPANNRPDDKPDKSYMYAGFKSSTSEYHLQRSKKNSNSNNDQFSRQAEPPQKKRLGMHAINPQYKSPVVQQPPAVSGEPMQIDDDDESNHPLLKGIDPKLIDQIKTEIVASGSKIDWNDIAGLDEVKMEIQEAVTLPLECPWLFSGNGMLKLEKGILLFGPPGTGKTLIAKCVSAQCQATFFSISASSLTSKWIGEGEKLVKALFAYARVKQPSVIFIDEVDSILTKRGDNDHESSTRLKTEFMIQLDGANSTKENDRILVIGATNRPQKLDEAVIRRFSKRFFIPLPDLEAS